MAEWIYVTLTSVHLSWAQELATYMFVWMAKFGAALGVRTGIHVGVDVFVKQLAPESRKPVILFALACGALFTGIIGTLGAVYVYELDADQVSQELEWPSWMIYLCIPLGSYLMCFRFLQVMWRYVRSGYVPHQGHGVEIQIREAAEALDGRRAQRRHRLPSRRDDQPFRNPVAATARRPFRPGDADRGDPDRACNHLRAGALRRHRAVPVNAHGAAVRAAARPDGDRHADLDRARPVGAHISVHPVERRSQDGRAQAVHQHRPLRDHGDPILHPGRQLSHFRWGGAAH